MPAGVVVLGSTGSIGRQTLEVLAAHPDRFRVVALAAAHPSPAFDEQLEAWPEARAWCASGRPARIDPSRWADGGLEELATQDAAELVVVATTGMTALPAVLAALGSGRRVALANKETLVTGGHLVARALDAGGGDPLDRLRPIDSEHSAIWQCLRGEPMESVRRLVLTASGGPFLRTPPHELAARTPQQALAHPTWRMGPKITIDSATLVNKAFEVIEARWLYRLPYSTIAAVIHPQSVVHSLVEFVDGSFKAQLGVPDMRLPIQYALTAPERLPSPARHAPPEAWGSLEFEPLDVSRYPAYAVARAAAEAGGNRGTILNAADEVAVAAFLEGRIGFDRIATVIETAVDRWGTDAEPELDEIGVLDAEVRAALGADLAVHGDA
ncbi:MAG TPA: 1-deoxy-D-xylulose-5-phosphate reductoisomerase [candidate division Zixibacteria bacterium]|nr:1-deoxy-D-xylulose-5-phosphate reductoisomerase [candidate division Zixibacteria bacterium]